MPPRPWSELIVFVVVARREPRGVNLMTPNLTALVAIAALVLAVVALVLVLA